MVTSLSIMFIGPTLKNLHIRLELENLASKLSGQKYNFWQFDARNFDRSDATAPHLYPRDVLPCPTCTSNLVIGGCGMRETISIFEKLSGQTLTL